MNKKISEPAFPGERLVMSAGYKTKEREPVAGMTLRDYFAAKAMQGMLANSNTTGFDAFDVVGAAWMFADSMLAERAA
jgi:hypothetical protein